MRIKILVLSSIVFCNQSVAQYNMVHAIGFNLMLLGEKTGSNPFFSMGIQYIPRLNHALGEKSSVSIASPMIVGLDIPKMFERGDPQLVPVIDLPLSVEFNLGHRANNYNENKFGIGIGAGIGYTYVYHQLSYIGYNYYLGIRSNRMGDKGISGEYRLNYGAGFGKNSEYVKFGLSYVFFLN